MGTKYLLENLLYLDSEHNVSCTCTFYISLQLWLFSYFLSGHYGFVICGKYICVVFIYFIGYIRLSNLTG